MYDGIEANASDGDDRALVFKVIWHGKTFLFVNDIGFFSEKVMLDSGVDIQCDVLVCGKHKDQQSIGVDIFNAASPQVVIATSFRYGYTEQRYYEWIKMVEETGAKLFLQTDSGAVSVRKSGSELEFVPMLGEPWIMPSR